MRIGKKRKDILMLIRMGLFCLKVSVSNQDRLSKKEGIMITSIFLYIYILCMYKIDTFIYGNEQ